MNTYTVEVFNNKDNLLQTTVLEADTAKQAIDRVKERLAIEPSSYIYFTAKSCKPENKRYDVFLYAGGKLVDRLQVTGSSEDVVLSEALRTFSIRHGSMTGVSVELVLQEHESLG